MTAELSDSDASKLSLEGLAAPAKLSLRSVTKAFPTREGIIEALQPTSLEVKEGEFLVIVGPSGCGKSTLLNLIAGFETPTSGEIMVDGKRVTGPGFDRMMMFQEHALFPWLSVLDNIIFGLKRKKKLSASDRREVARYYLKLVHLSRFENAWVHELSGGMKQRVALARALAPNPRVMLIDEPFASLDALTRERLYLQIQEIFARTRKTFISVTHNVREAACLADRVVVFTSRPGRIKREILVDLSRPRSMNDTGVSQFAAKILGELRTELTAEEDEGGMDETKHDRHPFLRDPDTFVADGI